jgi:hypothetical protein
VVAPGLAITLLPVVVFNPVAGLHVYVLAPLAVIVTEVLEQSELGLMITVGEGLMVTVEVPGLKVQPPPLPLTVYIVVVLPGEAVTTLPLVELSPVAGDQV